MRARAYARTTPTGDPMPIDHIGEAHDRVDAGSRQRILLTIPS